jgi:hypothetical protein
MGSPTRYACYEKKMLGWIHEKMATQESTPGGGRFSTFDSMVVENGTSTCNGSCITSEGYSTVAGNGS